MPLGVFQEHLITTAISLDKEKQQSANQELLSDNHCQHTDTQNQS